MFNFKSLTKAAAAAMVASSLMATGAVAKEKINVTVLSGYPERTAWVRVFKEFWMPEVNKRLAEGGNYELNYLEAFGTVVKPRGEFDGTQSGIGQIGLVVSAFHADRVPLSSISYVTPFVSVDLALNPKVNDAVTFATPAMTEAWQAHNLEFLGHMATIKTYAMLSKEPIETLEDFDGLKVSGAGLNLRWLEGLGSTGVPSALTKFYHDVDSGVTDAMIAWADAVGAFKLCESAPYFLSADMGAVTALAVVANKKWYDALPQEVKDVISDVTPMYRDELARQSTEGDQKGREACVAQGGTIVELPADQRQIWAETMPNIAKEWAAAADADGLPGTEVLEAYMDAMRAENQPIARHWDKE